MSAAEGSTSKKDERREEGHVMHQYDTIGEWGGDDWIPPTVIKSDIIRVDFAPGYLGLIISKPYEKEYGIVLNVDKEGQAYGVVEPGSYLIGIGGRNMRMLRVKEVRRRIQLFSVSHFDKVQFVFWKPRGEHPLQALVDGARKDRSLDAADASQKPTPLLFSNPTLKECDVFTTTVDAKKPLGIVLSKPLNDVYANVSSVRYDGQGNELGLNTGDFLVGINGQNVKHGSVTDVEKSLQRAKETGKDFKVVIWRQRISRLRWKALKKVAGKVLKGAKRRYSLQRCTVIGPLFFKAGAVGVTLEKDNGHDYATVVGVEPGSAGEKAGIQPGDALVAVGGKNLRKGTLADVRRIMALRQMSMAGQIPWVLWRAMHGDGRAGAAPVPAAGSAPTSPGGMMAITEGDEDGSESEDEDDGQGGVEVVTEADIGTHVDTESALFVPRNKHYHMLNLELPRGRLGITLKMDEGGFPAVEALAPGTIGVQAGLNKGDWLVAVERVGTKGKTLQEAQLMIQEQQLKTDGGMGNFIFWRRRTQTQVNMPSVHVDSFAMQTATIDVARSGLMNSKTRAIMDAKGHGESDDKKASFGTVLHAARRVAAHKDGTASATPLPLNIGSDVRTQSELAAPKAAPPTPLNCQVLPLQFGTGPTGIVFAKADPHQYGVVTDVMENSQAALLGVRPGDFIVSCNGRNVKHLRQGQLRRQLQMIGLASVASVDWVFWRRREELAKVDAGDKEKIRDKGEGLVCCSIM